MKKSILLLFMMISSLVLAQSQKPAKVKIITVKQKVCRSQKGFQFVLKTIENDSRCPKGTTCIWEGEVSAVLQVFDGQKQVEETTLVFNEKNKEANKKWFATYLPVEKQKIESLLVRPYPVEGSSIKPADYAIQIGYIK
nr:hypothetical protein [uncultured Flavobacterium sp.]